MEIFYFCLGRGILLCGAVHLRAGIDYEQILVSRLTGKVPLADSTLPVSAETGKVDSGRNHLSNRTTSSLLNQELPGLLLYDKSQEANSWSFWSCSAYSFG